LSGVDFAHLSEVVDEVKEKFATSDLLPQLLGDLADARPTIFSATEQEFNAVDICSLIGTFLLCCFVT